MTKKIATHSGKFHADEALACALLKMLPEYADASVTRTRDYALLETMDVVVDVGGVYDPAKHRYDHHQPTFKDTFGPEYKTLLSSAGLVYKHFGPTIIRSVLCPNMESSVDEALITEIYERLYRKFIEPFDAIDNGVNQYPGDLEPAYSRPYDVSSMVDDLNPGWNEDQGAASADARFSEAMALCGKAFSTQLSKAVNSWLPARKIVTDALQQCSLQDAEESRILVLGRNCPWKEHLFELEEAKGLQGCIIYVLYEDPNEGTWRIQAMSAKLDSFESRKALPEAWRGLRDAELDAESGIEGCTFVHRSGFIGGNRTFEGAKAMAVKALKL